MKNKAVFLDRDGTLNLNTTYPHHLDDLYILSGVSEALTLFKQLWYLLILTTNQSGISRGYFTEEQFFIFTHALEKAIGHRFDDIYYCPHHPDERCTCRKPKPGMLLQAAQEHQIDLRQSIMIGDSPSDVVAGKKAGCQTMFLDEHILPESDHTFSSLLAAAQYLQWLSLPSTN